MSLISALETADQIARVLEVAMNFAKEAIRLGKDDPAAELQKLIDADPLVKRAQNERENAADKKFGPE